MKNISALGCLFLFLLLASCSPQEQEKQEPGLVFQEEEQLEDISFRGAEIDFGLALISGTKGRVYLAELKDKKWKALMIPESDSLDFRDVAILNESTLLAMSAGSGLKSRIYKSTDRGASWQLVYQNEETKAFFNGFDFWDAQNGILVSDAIDETLYLLKTEDGGATWNRVGEGGLPPLFEGEYGFAASGTGINAFGKGEVRIATGGSNARIFASTDYGKTWDVMPVPIRSGNASSGIFSVDLIASNQIVAVGGDYNDDQNIGGNVALTNDGHTWFLPEKGDSIRFLSCARFLSPEQILATGTSGTVLMRQNEQKWTYKSFPETYHTAAYSSKDNLGILAGSTGRVRWFSVAN